MIASVSGNLTFTVVPAPIAVSTVTLPPTRSMFVLTTSMPTPRPLTSVTFSAREKPGRKIRFSGLALVHRAGLLGREQSAGDGLLLEPGRVDAAAVVADGDIDFARLVEGPQHDRGLGRLAGRPALLRRLDAVIDGVPHQVSERVANGLDDRLVEFHLRPFDLQVALLAQLGAQIADDARKAVEHRADRLACGPA